MENIETAAEKYLGNVEDTYGIKKAFIAGAKFQENEMSKKYKSDEIQNLIKQIDADITLYNKTAVQEITLHDVLFYLINSHK